ncbi:SDR family oxidoreductase [Paraflavitalea sp. CAU 1676]|uniref:SDR family oxidoreductase n=1 Tax=Paraflavitalea sp. CAU 1676 TaxID=3032598 RepID=UPI0023DA5B68|nr:SDR family oxidoreductase [Paraflavitalea sp. CAU 1676]MDF2187462.1 SDR family oxidoreductase [Paraflavitalea sp. CAU 1676]
MKRKVLITGGAGFIGSNICEKLLMHPDVEVVRVIDNLITGSKRNIAGFLSNPKFEFIEGDIRDYETVVKASKGMTAILHQAALGSVPRSIQSPITTNEHNVTGTLNVFFAAKENQVKKIAFASSSSTYGNNPDLPKIESKIGDPLSPYAVTKLISELYAKVFSNLYDFHYIGFRYFNVFGPRQNPQGPYAAVIPIFFKEMMAGRSPVINGNGEQSRDFTFVENVVDVNIGTIFNENPSSWNNIYNIAYGSKTSLNQLFYSIAKLTGYAGEPIHGPDRAGDIRDSLAEISKATGLLQYQPVVSITEGLERTYQWYLQNPDFFG